MMHFDLQNSSVGQNGTMDGIDMDVENILLLLLFTLITLCVVIGNLLVILSVVLYRRMHIFTNILLVSLACSDLLLGVMVLPFSMVYQIGTLWRAGKWLCHIWATIDVLLCTASILNLCTISIDRYCAISWPLRYSRYRSTKLAAGYVFTAWFLSLLICIPPWFVPDWGFIQEQYACGYASKLGYRIYSACGSFFMPLLLMLFVYYKIFRVSAERERNIKFDRAKSGSKVMKVHRGGAKGGNNSAIPPATSRLLSKCDLKDSSMKAVSSPALNRHKDSSTESPPLQMTSSFIQNSAAMYIEESCTIIDQDQITDIQCPNSPPLDINRDLRRARIAARLKQHGDSHSPYQPNFRFNPARLIKKATNLYSNGKLGHRVTKETRMYFTERKALKTIGVVVCGFVFCWFPFFLLYILESACQTACAIPPQIFAFVLWLGYSNSALNPVIYAMYNQDFRRCFKDIATLGCLRRRVDRRMSVKRLHQVRSVRVRMG